ncbi:hypothetical protein HDU91_002656, partial [Kappamyces sp. JEL0680]
MNKLLTLKNYIFNSSKLGIPLRPRHKAIAKGFNDRELVNYYPPNICVMRLSKQDRELRPLKLRDEWLDQKRDKELALEARRKKVRVSALLGPLKPEAQEK